jgi:hypothetical protein
MVARMGEPNVPLPFPGNVRPQAGPVAIGTEG